MNSVTPTTSALLPRAVGWRQGIVSSLRPVPHTLADLPVAGYAAVPEPTTTGGTSGGAAETDDAARVAAVAEALERQAAARCPLQTVPRREVPESETVWELADFSLHSAEQRADPDFRYPGYDDPAYTRVWTLPANEPVWVPAGLVGLQERYGLATTSSGLAAGASVPQALLRGLQELVERDAFTVAWLHSVGAPRVALPAELEGQASERGGRVWAFDLTPAFSPHPVVAVAGTLPLAGVDRPTLGLACRASWAEAVQKAWLEWCQGTVFIAVALQRKRPPVATADDVTDFDRHALYYAGKPKAWADLPFWSGRATTTRPNSPASGAGTAAELTELVSTLTSAGVRLAYRDLTTPELRSVGLHAVRLLSPDLTPLHPDHRWPHLDGRTSDLAWRFPSAVAGGYPNPNPHPLG